MLTPQKIQDLSDPIESVYIHMADELLVNIGKHITKPTWTHTAAWEIQKLSELGQLTKENAAIINRWVKAIPQEVRDTMEATRAAALSNIEKELDKAAKDGYVTPPLADSTVNVLREYEQQAADKLNLVNTTMLQSSLAQYSKAVQLTADDMRRSEATQGILNDAAGNVAIGAETRYQAMRRAITRVSEEGLTGFIDRSGRSWTPEAYVNMVIRTTVHNVAIQSAKNRMQDYGTNVFQVSAHAGARPLCYPYQAKFYSWDNTSGEMITGHGEVIRYETLNSTSYGQPAGLFGINCGHFPIPMVPGVSIPHAEEFVQPKEENDKLYAESQEQRALERKIRAAKRVVEMGDDSKDAKQRIRDAQARMREFINRTGRTRRYDREQIGGTPRTETRQQAKPEPVKTDVFSNVKGVSDDFKAGMRDTLAKSGEERAQRVFEKYADELVCNDAKNKRGAYFSSRTKGIHINAENAASGSNYQKPYEVAFHEFGHMIDWLAGGKNPFQYLSNTPRGGKELEASDPDADY